MSWRATTTLFEEKNIQRICPSSNNIWLGSKVSYKRTGAKSEECTEKNGEQHTITFITWKDRK